MGAMPFSYTAPRFTAAMEQEEINNLTEEERRRIDADIGGGYSSFEDDEGDVEGGVEEQERGAGEGDGGDNRGGDGDGSIIGVDGTRADNHMFDQGIAGTSGDVSGDVSGDDQAQVSSAPAPVSATTTAASTATTLTTTTTARKANDAEDDEQRLLKLRMFNDEMSKLPLNSTQGYLKALEATSRDFVHSETDPIVFMRTAPTNDVQMSAASAAQRVAKYWSSRNKFFQEESYLPMSLHSSLNEEDQVTIRRGIVRILGKDQSGRWIFHIHRAAYSAKTTSRNSVFRVCFCLLQWLAKRPDAQGRGIVMLVNLLGFDMFANFNRALIKTIVSTASDCMPFRMKAWHITVTRSIAFTDMVLPSLKYLLGRENRLRLLLHGDHCLDSLASFGIGPECVPIEMGGGSTMEEFLSLMELPIDVEFTEQGEHIGRSGSGSEDSLSLQS